MFAQRCGPRKTPNIIYIDYKEKGGGGRPGEGGGCQNKLLTRAIETNGEHMALSVHVTCQKPERGVNIMTFDTWSKPGPLWLWNKPWSKREDIKFYSQANILRKANMSVEIVPAWMLVPLALVELFFNHVITGSGLPVALHMKDAIKIFSALYTQTFRGWKVIEGSADK